MPIIMFGDAEHRPQPTQADRDRRSGGAPDYAPGDNDRTVSGPAEMDDDTLAWKVEGREEEILAILCFALDNTTLLETVREQHPKEWREACLDVVAEKELK